MAQFRSVKLGLVRPVPVVTDAEKHKRRQKIVAKRRIAARKIRRQPPLPPRQRGADLPYKEFKTIAFYDESNEHHHVLLSRVPAEYVPRIRHQNRVTQQEPAQ